MQICKIRPHGYGSNSYILTEDGKSAIVVDCAQPRVYDMCMKFHLNPEYVLLTHGHFDHVGGCGVFYENGAKILCSETEKPLIFSKDYLGIFGGVQVPRFEIYNTFSDGEELELCGIKIKVLATPGHSAGSVTFLIADTLFTGDTLLCDTIGRTDLPTGNTKKLYESITKLYALKGDYRIACGHDDDTTLEHERKFNPYVRY